ncbi:hypothetical protein L5515_005413 [Caenorhabditis briggsae]|uniref:Protein arginine N-methyltransferase n=1 Tax=Caenorhabditis briggsae TaxID=6238 RepID=A0AAE9JD89_CAEBR|nr:hypothetical protein L5515_005413 [Caenorhabditis briggsae]
MSSHRTYADDLFPQEVMDSGTATPPQDYPSSTSSQSSHQHYLESANSRIHVGWVTSPYEAKEELDTAISGHCSRLGEAKYTFVAFPVGGVVRGFWKPVEGAKNEPPAIQLPDVQLANNLWETYVTGRTSPWIDCDSEDPKFAEISEESLITELNYIAYMGLNSMTIQLNRISSPRTAALFNKWVWTRNTRFTMWIQLPSSVEQCLDFDPQSTPKNMDIWTIWANFRQGCYNFSGVYLQAMLRIAGDLPDEFVDTKRVDRWKAEPLGGFVVETDVYATDRNGMASLSSAHISFLRQLWSSDDLRILVDPKTDTFLYNVTLKAEYALALRQAVRDVNYKSSESSTTSLAVSEYKDVLQAPLQPLSENLDSSVYNVFEQDKIKYDAYGDAVMGVLKELGADGRKEIVIYLLGGGRGPISSPNNPTKVNVPRNGPVTIGVYIHGTTILRAEKDYNTKFRQKGDHLKVKLYIVEKNANAIITLRYMNHRTWRRRVTIIESDMRRLPEIARKMNYHQPDLIVSELLGSIGDNELSPECLDGVTDFLKPETISIPQKYISYVAPIMSNHIHQTIRAQSIPYLARGLPSHGRLQPELNGEGAWVQLYPQGDIINNMDQIYVVFLSKYISLSRQTKEMFTFQHPNFQHSTNERSAFIEFPIDRNTDIMGFAGYFDLHLYKNVILSTVPETHTPGMMSWFPALIPLREQLRADDGDTVALKINRKVDQGGVWYEWSAQLKKPNGEIITTPIQNPNGESYYMRM